MWIGNMKGGQDEEGSIALICNYKIIESSIHCDGFVEIINYC